MPPLAVGHGPKGDPIEKGLDRTAGVQFLEHDPFQPGGIHRASGLAGAPVDRHYGQFAVEIHQGLERLGPNPRLVDGDHGDGAATSTGRDAGQRTTVTIADVGHRLQPSDGAFPPGHHDLGANLCQCLGHPVDHRSSGQLDRGLVGAHADAASAGQDHPGHPRPSR